MTRAGRVLGAAVAVSGLSLYAVAPSGSLLVLVAAVLIWLGGWAATS